MSARMDAAGYTTSGRGGSKSSAQKKAPVAKKAAPAAKKSAGKPAGKFPASMSVPGSARPMSPADHKLVRQRTAASKSSPIPSVPATGRDRLGTTKFFGSPSAKTPANRPGINRQEVEAGVMSKMRRDRLGPGQR